MDWKEVYEKQQAVLDKNDADAKRAGKLVGRYIQHAAADGHAIYVITAQRGNNVTIEASDIGDGYMVAAWGRKAQISVQKANAFLASRDMWDSFHSATDNWWNTRTIGEVVHYSNGFNQFVRGTITMHENKKQMMPTALVGEWNKFDLVTRRPNGTITYGTHAKRIVDKEPFQPNASNMVEYPEHKLRGMDPRGMVSLSLEVPAMDAEAQALAGILKLQEEVKSAIACPLSNNPSVDYANVKAALRNALNLLNERL